MGHDVDALQRLHRAAYNRAVDELHARCQASLGKRNPSAEERLLRRWRKWSALKIAAWWQTNATAVTKAKRRRPGALKRPREDTTPASAGTSGHKVHRRLTDFFPRRLTRTGRN